MSVSVAAVPPICQLLLPLCITPAKPVALLVSILEPAKKARSPVVSISEDVVPATIPMAWVPKSVAPSTIFTLEIIPPAPWEGGYSDTSTYPYAAKV